MAGHSTSNIPVSLKILRRLGNKRMADAHQAIADSQRIAAETAAIRAETRSLHNRFHPNEMVPVSLGVTA